jgi:hypothetical protein
MKVIVTTPREVEAKTLHVEAGVRYWEDAHINGKEDAEGKLIPCREGDMWKPIIDIDSGQILNWIKGRKADIYFKVCDSGSYFIKDADGNTLLSIEDDYVPDIMSPKDAGYGDYTVSGLAKWLNPNLNRITKL